jgi:nucleotide-binding universal stress UspA family protein
MIQIANVLCPVDFSEVSRHALDHAAAIAGWYEARLHVLHVFQNRPAMDLPPMVLEDRERECLVGRLHEFVAPLPRNLPLELSVREASDIHREILAQAESVRADLLVIGSHGRSGVDRLLLGSVAEKIIRRTRRPVMVVPARAPDVPPDAPVHFERILCAVDFSDGSKRALEYAINMAEEADARLTVLHVIEVPPELQTNPLSADFDVARLRAVAEAASLRRLRELIPAAAGGYCTLESAVREGAAYREILKEAVERAADLIVMGVRGRGAIDLLVFGSNTARVTRTAVCPVLIVPE